MGGNLFGLIPALSVAQSLTDVLDSASYDELAEINCAYDEFRAIHHVEGKYFLPFLSSRLSVFVSYAGEHMIHPEDRAKFLGLLDQSTLLERIMQAEYKGLLHEQIRLRLLDGGWRWTEFIVIGADQDDLAQDVFRLYVFDVQYQHDRQLGVTSSYPASGDRNRLTGLLSERAFFQIGNEILAGDTVRWCLAAIDIENFQLFNDWYGREAGDIVLAKIGGILKRVANHTGGLAGYRLQDDFCILMPYDEDYVGHLYEEIEGVIKEYGSSIGFMPAIGIRLIEPGLTMVHALDHALLAVSHIKGDFHARIRLYDQSMRSTREEEYRVLYAFQKAISDHEVFFVLQPQCRVSTGKVVGAESLARWRKADGTVFSPKSFVPILEKYGFVTDLDKYVWEEVCSWLSSWIASGNTPVPISMNVSQTDILTIDVPDYLDMLTEKYQVPHDLIKVEITESAYAADTDRVMQAVQRLRDMGFMVLMDDFGSGYSSLNMLRRLNVDVVKMDAQFLRLNDEDDRKGVHIIEMILNMTRTMALPIIVEGVETKKQLDFLDSLGCRYIQGFYFYRPMMVSDFERLISNQDNVDTRGILFKSNQQFQIREFMDLNIYSDAMLNNIIGAAALYSWDGDKNVDIVRYNEQFYHMVGVPDFSARIKGIQRFFHPDDVEPLYETLARAEKDHLNGSSHVFGVYRSDSSLGHFQVKFYHLEDRESGKLFYGSMRETTQMEDLKSQMNLITEYASHSTVFLRKTDDGWSYQVIVHGLNDHMGLSTEEFEQELTNGSFYGRVDPASRRKLWEITMQSESQKVAFGFPFTFSAPAGKDIRLFVKCDAVIDPHCDVHYILNFNEIQSFE